MNQLIQFDGKKPTVTSLVIAEQFGRRHKTVIRSIESLIDSGHIGGHEFVPTSYTDKSNRQSKCYHLTEDGFLIAMPFIGGQKSKDGQRALVKAFSKYRRHAELRAKRDWQEARANGKLTRHQETDVIQQFIQYAEQQGSQHASHYYQNLTKATYKALFLVDSRFTGLREHLDPVQLSILATAEHVVRQALLQGMEQDLPYKTIYANTRDRIQSLGSTIGRTSLITGSVV